MTYLMAEERRQECLNNVRASPMRRVTDCRSRNRAHIQKQQYTKKTTLNTSKSKIVDNIHYNKNDKNNRYSE